MSRLELMRFKSKAKTKTKTKSLKLVSSRLVSTRHVWNSYTIKLCTIANSFLGFYFLLFFVLPQLRCGFFFRLPFGHLQFAESLRNFYLQSCIVYCLVAVDVAVVVTGHSQELCNAACNWNFSQCTAVQEVFAWKVNARHPQIVNRQLMSCI